MTKQEWKHAEVAEMFAVSTKTVQNKLKLGLDLYKSDDVEIDKKRMRPFFMSVQEMSNQDKQQAMFQKDLADAFTTKCQYVPLDNPIEVLDFICSEEDEEAWKNRHRSDLTANRALWCDVAVSLSKAVRNGEPIGQQEAFTLLCKNGLEKCTRVVLQAFPESKHRPSWRVSQQL